MSKIYIIDTSSLIHISFYYNDKGENFTKVIQLLKKLIEEEKLIILDKVSEEFRNSKIKSQLGININSDEKENVKYIINTYFLESNFDNLAEKFYIKANERFYTNRENISKEELISNHKEEFKEINADLYLILYSKYLKENGFEPIIINDENMNPDNKLYEKIPSICIEEKIHYIKSPQFIFEYFNLALKEKEENSEETKVNINENNEEDLNKYLEK